MRRALGLGREALLAALCEGVAEGHDRRGFEELEVREEGLFGVRLRMAAGGYLAQYPCTVEKSM